MRKPRSTERIFSKLRSNRPEAVSSTRATASSAITRTERKRAWPAPALPVRPPSFSASFTSVRAAAKAGIKPHRQPVSSTSPSAKATTCQSRPMELTRGSVSGKKLMPARSATQPAPTP